jgi:hypothetical protein
MVALSLKSGLELGSPLPHIRVTGIWHARGMRSITRFEKEVDHMCLFSNKPYKLF